MKENILDQFRLTVLEKGLNVYGIRVRTGDGESVSHRWRSDDRECIYSGSKSFTLCAVGMCVDEGKLRLSDPILGLFPEYRELASPGSEKITLRDLLHMASGKLAFWFDASLEEMDQYDWAELFFRVPVQKEPGTYFFYSNACTYMLGRAVEKVTGQPVRDFLMPRLFQPFGIWNPQWDRDPRGHTIAASGLYLTTEEYSRLGWMLLNKGVYDGTRIVSEEFLAQAVSDVLENSHNGTDSESNCGYAYQMWRCTPPNTYRTDGKYGQFNIVVPDRNAVITVTAHEENAPNDIIRAVFHDIVPQIEI